MELTNGSILVIDDRPDETRHLFSDLGSAVEVVHPNVLDEGQFNAAKVALVDHDLKDVDWPERAAFPLSCRPMDGIALAQVLLSYGRKNPRILPTAVAILSNELELITPDFSDVPEHLAARASGLHWAFWKNPKPVDAEPPLTTRVQMLACAVNALPKRWDGEGTEHLKTLLNLSDSDEWATRGLAHALRCRPPINELADWTSGLAFIRWLAQLVLPYPTCLVGTDALAIRLGINPMWMRSHLEVGKPIQRVFESAEYRGILSGFLGRRWWIAGVDAVLWEKSSQLASSRDAILKWLGGVCGESPEPVEPNVTLVLGDRLIVTGEIARFDDCVRVSPDDWPSFADDPWTTRDLAVRNERLRALVDPDDLESLKSHGK